jgi:hypothetical protein
MSQSCCAPFCVHRVSFLRSQSSLSDERLVETKSFESYAPSGRVSPDGCFPGVKTPGLESCCPFGAIGR